MTERAATDLMREETACDGRIGEFELLQRIGQAHFGPVFKARHRPSGALRALKVFRKALMDSAHTRAFLEEAELAEDATHEHVLRTFGHFEDARAFYLESEYLPGGELFQVIARESFFAEDKARATLRRLLEAVAYLHARGVAHRDVKPENIVLARKGDLESFKLIDFGSARRFGPQTAFHDFYGTAYYIAPEVFRRTGTAKVDVWACGVIAYVLLCGVPPFPGDSNEEIYASVQRGRPGFTEAAWAFVSPEARRFVEWLLREDPGIRPDAEETLGHPWLCGAAPVGPVDLAREPPGSFRALGPFCAVGQLQRALKLFVMSKREMEEARREAEEESSVPTDGEAFAGRRKVLCSQLSTLDEPRMNGRKPCVSSWPVPVATLEDFDKLFTQIDQDGDGWVEGAPIKGALLRRFFRQAASEPETAALAAEFGAKERLSRVDFAAMWRLLAG